MRNVLPSLILILAFASNVFSQGTTWGVKAGANLSTLTNEDDFMTKFGFQFGAVANIEFNDNFSLQPEILYSAQGYDRDFNSQDIVGRIDYLILPVTINYEFVDDLNLQLGPQLGINTRSELEIDGQEGGVLTVQDVDFGLVFGLQLNIDDNFFIQGRYNLGLSEVQLNRENKNSVFSLSLGFFFDNYNEEDDEDDFN